MDEDKLNALLAQEYLSLQKAIAGVDERMLTIKAWSVTASGAALATAYINGKPMILMIGAVRAVVFWVIEAFWKVNQRFYAPRVLQIEAHFSEAGPATKPFQLIQAVTAAYANPPNKRRHIFVMAEPLVALPHAAVFVAGLLLYAFARPV